MFGGFGITELIVILVIVLLLFGTKKLRNIGGDLGGAIKGFRKAMSSDDEPKLVPDEPQESIAADDTTATRDETGSQVSGSEYKEQR